MRDLILVLSFLSAFGVSFSQDSYADSLNFMRQKYQKEFLEKVLNEEERKVHPQLCYFPPDTSFIVEARFKKKVGQPFAMPMSKERLVLYRKIGILSFKINDTLCNLTVYQNLALAENKAYKNYYFIPFKDATTSISTYGAGKYMDCYFLKKAKKVRLDFNASYHPYCAYSERYSCPVVPQENTIPVAITAGECYQNHEE